MVYPVFPLSVDHRPPTIVEIGGFPNSARPDWLSLWQRDFPEWVSVPVYDGVSPSDWFRSIETALAVFTRPVIILGSGNACDYLSEWIDSRPGGAWRHIDGALLIAPGFTPKRALTALLVGESRRRLPFPSVVIASQDSSVASHGQMRRAAFEWGSRLVDGGAIGRCAEAPRLRDWPHGRHVLDWLVEVVEERQQLRRAHAILAPALHACRSNPNKF